MPSFEELLLDCRTVKYFHKVSPLFFPHFLRSPIYKKSLNSLNLSETYHFWMIRRFYDFKIFFNFYFNIIYFSYFFSSLRGLIKPYFRWITFSILSRVSFNFLFKEGNRKAKHSIFSSKLMASSSFKSIWQNLIGVTPNPMIDKQKLKLKVESGLVVE